MGTMWVIHWFPFSTKLTLMPYFLLLLRLSKSNLTNKLSSALVNKSLKKANFSWFWNYYSHTSHQITAGILEWGPSLEDSGPCPVTTDSGLFTVLLLFCLSEALILVKKAGQTLLVLILQSWSTFAVKVWE